MVVATRYRKCLLWRDGSSIFSNQNLTTSGIEVVCAEVTMVTIESYNTHCLVLTDIRLSDLGPCHLRHVVDVTSLPLSEIRTDQRRLVR